MRRGSLLAASLLLVAGCGSNQSREEIRAAAGLSQQIDAPAASDGPDSPGANPNQTPSPGATIAGGSELSDADGHQVEGSVAARATPAAAAAASSSGCADPCAPLVLGSVGTWSGLVGQNVIGGLHALRAWVAATNAAGGLAGHEVRLEVADDGADPARHRALVQELVEDRGVLAFVYNAAVFSGQASVGYLEKHRIPVVGGAGTDPWYTTSPMFFSQVIAGATAIEATTASYARSAKAAGLSRMGLVTCSDGVQVCEDTQREVPKYAEQYGVELVYNGEASLAAPDFTANCLAARDADVEILYLALDGNSYTRFGRACANIGYQPKYGIAQPVMLEELARDPNMQGSPGVSYTAPFFFDRNPAIAEFQRTMAQHAPGIALTGTSSLGWSSAKLLEIAATRLSATPTSADILEGLWSLDGDDLGGLVSPLRFQRDAPTVPAVCYWQVVVEDGTYRTPDDGQRHCEGR